jgi:tRNA threonylcarbamoyladenosine biosynthesis protein TsaE
MNKEFTLDEIDTVAAELWQLGKNRKVWTFDGDMGAGKTTLIAAICRHLGVNDAVSSPTFALVNEYHFEQDGVDTILYHSDWYRLSGTEEAIESGLEDLFADKTAYCFVEWPDKATAILPKDCLVIHIRSKDISARIISTND